MRRFTFCLVVLVTMAALTGHADAALVQVSQESSSGAGDFDANVLGYIEPYVTGMTVAAFYQYGNPFGASYNGELNGGPNPISSLTQIFLVSTSDGLSLFVVHDRPNDGSGGNTAMQWDLVGDTAGYLQGDDPGEGLVGGGTTFTTTHGWAPCCTDGFVIGSLEGGWSVFGAFLTDPTGILDWAATNNDEDETKIPLKLVPGRRVRLAAMLEATIEIKPETLNLNSKGEFTAFIDLPGDYDEADIDIDTVECEGAPALKGMMADDGRFIAKFDREDLGKVPTGEAVELTVTGKLTDGTMFIGSDIIRVIGPGKPAPSSRAKLSTFWGKLKAE